MPTETLDDDESVDLLVEKYDELLSSIEKPISYDEGCVLVSLFPEEAFYDLQWDLLKLVESLYGNIKDEEYLNLINKCPSEEWKDGLLTRFNNAKK